MGAQDHKSIKISPIERIKELLTGNERMQWIIICCAVGILFVGLLIALILGTGSEANTSSPTITTNETTDNIDSIKVKNNVFEKAYDEYRAVMNAELAKDNEYSELTLSEFKEIGTDEEYKDYEYLKDNLYRATITQNANVYVVANSHSGKISQIRYSINIKDDARNARFLGWLLGRTMQLMYGHVSDKDLEKVIGELNLEHPYEGMNITYTYNQNIYRTTLENNVWTIYITDTDYSFIEERQAAIVSYEEQTKINIAEAEKKRKVEAEVAAKLAEKERIFSAGKYRVGIDIDAGTYNIVALSGRGNCFIENASGRSILNEIFASVIGDSYIREYKNIDLSLGDTIEVKSYLKLKFIPVK